MRGGDSIGKAINTRASPIFRRVRSYACWLGRLQAKLRASLLEARYSFVVARKYAVEKRSPMRPGGQ